MHSLYRGRPEHGRWWRRGRANAWAVCGLILIAGCAAPLPPLDVSSSDPVCARSCLAKHSDCVSQAGLGMNAIVAGRVLQACRSTAESCLTTCPAK